MAQKGISISDLIGRIEGIPRALVRDGGPDMAAAIKGYLNGTIHAKTTPDHEAWAPRKRGTAPVLENAAEHVTVVAVGPQIFIRVIGVEARHHRGRIKGGTARPMIPTDKIPADMAAVMERVLRAHFDRQVSGAP